jgi:D-alanyl-D-alanine carboxypeptidase
VDDILVANKSYSLPPDYDPGLLPVTKEAFDELCAAAAAEGLNIYEGSGYRDYKFQVKVYNSMVSGYNKQYADTWSARPGHSEHQTGYTIDCNTKNEAFGNTDEGKWLAAHCHEYGFIIRYPKGKEKITGYNYESWHIRYVGREHARIIHDQDITLEEYLDIDSAYHDGDPDASLLGGDENE